MKTFEVKLVLKTIDEVHIQDVKDFVKDQLQDLDQDRSIEKMQVKETGIKLKKNVEEPRIDVFEMYGKSNKKAFKKELGTFTIEKLRLVIRQHRFDSTGLACRWKNKERLINFIYERTHSRSIKGDVFLNY